MKNVIIGLLVFVIIVLSAVIYDSKETERKMRSPLTIEHPITDVDIVTLSPDGRRAIVTLTQNGEKKIGSLRIDEWPKQGE